MSNDIAFGTFTAFKKQRNITELQLLTFTKGSKGLISLALLHSNIKFKPLKASQKLGVECKEFGAGQKLVNKIDPRSEHQIQSAKFASYNRAEYG